MTTTTMPTVPGYYWVRRSEASRSWSHIPNEPRVVRFELRSDWFDADDPDEPKVWLTGSDVDAKVEDFEWLAGPLVAPPEEE